MGKGENWGNGENQGNQIPPCLPLSPGFPPVFPSFPPVFPQFSPSFPLSAPPLGSLAPLVEHAGIPIDPPLVLNGGGGIGNGFAQCHAETAPFGLEVGPEMGGRPVSIGPVRSGLDLSFRAHMGGEGPGPGGGPAGAAPVPHRCASRG